MTDRDLYSFYLNTTAVLGVVSASESVFIYSLETLNVCSFFICNGLRNVQYLSVNLEEFKMTFEGMKRKLEIGKIKIMLIGLPLLYINCIFYVLFSFRSARKSE